jgi:tripartite-type tricarboxylate transporter receptor subunit TctC
MRMGSLQGFAARRRPAGPLSAAGRPWRLAAIGLTLAAFLLPGTALAGVWPERNVRIITGPLAPGSSIDAAARIIGDELAKKWKQTVVIENRPGADGIIAAQALLQARDGHTLLFTTHSILTVVPLLRETIPYDTARDFAPIALAVEDFLCVAAAPSLGARTLAEFVNIAKAKPGVLNGYAVPGSPWLAFMAFQKSAGIDTALVPYSTQANAIADLAEGRLHVAVMPLASVNELAPGGRIRMLAVTNARHAPAAPDIPTVGEAGFAEFTFGGLLGMFGPRDMPADLRERIAADMREVLARPAVIDTLAGIGMAVRGSTPAEFASILDEQRVKWAAIARDNGIKPVR